MSLIKDKDVLSGTFSFAGKASMRQFNFQLKRKTKKLKKNAFMNSYVSSTQKNFENSIYMKPYLNKKKFNIEKIDFLNLTYKKSKNLYEGDNYKYHKRNQKIFEEKKEREKGLKDFSSEPPMLYETSEKKPKKIRYILNWRKLTGRKPMKQEKENQYKNYSDINIITDNYKQIGFVDMSKQTQRNDNFLTNDLRKINGTKYIQLNLKEEKQKWKEFCKKPLIPKSPLSSDSENFSPGKRLILSSKRRTKKLKNFFASKFGQKINDLTFYKQNSVIDFEKTTGRENIFTDIKNRDNTPRAELHPNYNSIEERVKMMVVYKNKENKKEMHNMRQRNYEEYYATNENFENIYGHRLKSVPNFKQMMSRPTNNNLPIFMSGIYNRMFEYNLEMNIMNNYTDKNTNEDDKIKKIDKSKNKKKLKDKSKEMLKKFIKLYADICFSPIKKQKKKLSGLS